MIITQWERIAAYWLGRAVRAAGMGQLREAARCDRQFEAIWSKHCS